MSRSERSATGTRERLVGSMRDGVHAPPLQIANAPAWIDSRRFDLAGPGARPEDVRQMLHALLQDRFWLVARLTRTPVEVLALERRPPGRWLLQAQTDDTRATDANRCSPPASPAMPPGPPVYGEPAWTDCAAGTDHGNSGASHVTLGAASMHRLADALTRVTGRTVLDRTGLDGGYDAEVEFWWPSPGASAPDAWAAHRFDLASALDSHLGLVLRRTRAGAYLLTIERVEPLRPADDR